MARAKDSYTICILGGLVLVICRYAEVFTAEEVTRITRDKLIRLQSLYIEQFKWLQNVLRENRRKYLSTKDDSDELLSNG